MIEACFARAIDEITALPEATYIDLLVNLGKASGTKTGELIFNDREKQSIAGEGLRCAE